jgi:hypothetical protein
MKIEAVNSGGVVCATATAERRIAEPPPNPEDWPERPLPAVLMAATPEALAACPVLGSLRVSVSEEEGRQQLADVREQSDLYARERIVHPGHLLRFADSILAANVLLPPWMHVSSRAPLPGCPLGGAAQRPRHPRRSLREEGAPLRAAGCAGGVHNPVPEAQARWG